MIHDQLTDIDDRCNGYRQKIEETIEKILVHERLRRISDRGDIEENIDREFEQLTKFILSKNTNREGEHETT